MVSGGAELQYNDNDRGFSFPGAHCDVVVDKYLPRAE